MSKAVRQFPIAYHVANSQSSLTSKFRSDWGITSKVMAYWMLTNMQPIFSRIQQKCSRYVADIGYKSATLLNIVNTYSVFHNLCCDGSINTKFWSYARLAICNMISYRKWSTWLRNGRGRPRPFFKFLLITFFLMAQTLWNFKGTLYWLIRGRKRTERSESQVVWAWSATPFL